MEIKKQFKNSLLGREEIEFLIKENVAPSKEDLKKKLAEKFKKPENSIVIKTIYGNFGKREFLVNVFIYDSEEQKNKIEPKIKSKEKASSAPKTPQEMLEGK